ncbi:MAG: HAMP domain-containing histidine kinase [Pseudomonadales bacterium]|jgi:signal transduction histidine kinase|nr:HAMP domain-containing histidine kinase [Pseudomonadales bacterium]
MTHVKTWRLSLRLRIILALVLIATAMSTLLAYGSLEIKARLEEVIFGDIVRDEFSSLQMQLEDGDYDPSHLLYNWSFYYDDSLTPLPPALRTLAPGSYHSVIIADRYYQVEVGMNSRGQRQVLTYDLTAWETQEHAVLRLLAYGAGVQLLLAIVLGWLASSVILAPVRAFTRRLGAIDPRQRKVRIAQEFQGNEISSIAAEFDRYLSRLDRFVERERFFTAAASHELRTPLSVMLGALDILDNADLDGPSARARQRLRRACNEMKAFIEAALQLAREDATTIEEQQSCNLHTLLNELLEDQQSALSARHIIVERPAADAVVLDYSPSLLRILLGNLLRNAIEHTRDGRISVQLSPSAIVIEDSGSGIPSADLPHVFDRSYTTKEDGYGLGLNLVKRICDRFGWNIDIQSEVGKGTRVALALNP